MDAETEPDVLSLLARPVAFHPAFVKLTGSVDAAIMLSQAFYWLPRTTRGDGWFYKTRDQWQAETALSRSAQETARKHLRKCEFWQEERRGSPAQMFYRLDRQLLNRALVQMAGFRPTADGEVPAIKMAGIKPTPRARPSDLTETTTKTTPRTRESFVKPRPPAGSVTIDPNANAKRNLLAFLEEKIGPIPSRGRQTKALNWLLEREYSPAECAACLEWLLSQSWRTTVVTFATVEKEIGNWVRLGSPEAGEPTAPNGNGHHPEPQKYGDYISEDDLFVYTVGPEGPGGTIMRKPKGPEGVALLSGMDVEEVRKLWN